jgi:hypothetical protein
MESLLAEKRKRERDLDLLRISEPKLLKELTNLKENISRMHRDMQVSYSIVINVFHLCLFLFVFHFTFLIFCMSLHLSHFLSAYYSLPIPTSPLSVYLPITHPLPFPCFTLSLSLFITRPCTYPSPSPLFTLFLSLSSTRRCAYNSPSLFFSLIPSLSLYLILSL